MIGDAFTLTRRNLSIYLRDRVGVFLSLLSGLILLILYLLFLASLQEDTIREELPNATDEAIGAFINGWVLAGIVTLTVISTCLGALVVFVDDRSSGRFVEFSVMPTGRASIIAGYALAAWIVSTVVGTLILAIGVGALQVLNGVLPDPAGLAMTWLMVVLAAAHFAALSSFAITFIKSNAAFTAFSTILGTAVGFLAGTYLPPGLLSSSVNNFLNVLPFSHAAMLIRSPLVEPALEELTEGQAPAEELMREYYGFDLLIGSTTLTTAVVLGVLIGSTVLFGALGVFRLNRSLK